MAFNFEFVNNWSSSNLIKRPSAYLKTLPVEILLLIYEEIELMLENPFNGNRMHPLRDPWRGYYGWYPNKDSKIKDYRIIYKIQKKVLIFRKGHHSIVYKK